MVGGWQVSMGWLGRGCTCSRMYTAVGIRHDIVIDDDDNDDDDADIRKEAWLRGFGVR